MKKLAIYDLDGTIINSEHRYRIKENGKIDLQFWRENCIPEKISKDTLLPHSNQMFKDLKSLDTIVIIATAREMQKGDSNFKYIKKHLGEPHHIIHRKKGDTRKGSTLKTTEIMKNLKDVSLFDSITIYEDNLSYLQDMTHFFDKFNSKVYPIFVKSNQGH